MSNIFISNLEEHGALAAIRGVRQSYKTTDKSDSCCVNGVDILGPKDYNLLLGLSKKCESEKKFLRQMTISCDITAPLYWWKQFDTYKVGTTAQSESTMHTLTKREFERLDFAWSDPKNKHEGFFDVVIRQLNYLRKEYLTTTDKDEKKYLETLMIQLLPSGYFQKRTVTMNYCVLSHIYHDRYDHKLPEWRDFCDTIVGNIRYPAFIEPTPSVPPSGIPDVRKTLSASVISSALSEKVPKEETWDVTDEKKIEKKIERIIKNSTYGLITRYPSGESDSNSNPRRYCPFCGEELRIGEQGGYFCPNEDCDELKTTTDHDLDWFDCDYIFRLAQGRIEGKEATFCPFCGETLVEAGDDAKCCPNRNNANYPVIHNFYYKRLPNYSLLDSTPEGKTNLWKWGNLIQKPVCPVCGEKMALWRNELSGDILTFCTNKGCKNAEVYNASDMSQSAFTLSMMLVGMLDGSFESLSDKD
jgi:hypothetical protein